MQKYLILVLIIYFDLVVASLAFASEDGDWQFWSLGGMQVNLSESWKAGLEQQFRLGDNMVKLYYRYTDFGIAWRATPWFILGCDYAQIYEKREGDWKEENRPHLNGTFKWSWRKVGFEDRNSIERRIREGRENIWMYRKKLSFAIPTNWTRFFIQPYLADEIFLIADEGKLYRNRLAGGFRGQLLEHLGIDAYYLWQSSERGGNWIDYHVVGVKLKAAL